MALVGCEVPRLWTKPLRELTPETSHGFHVIAFAEQWLGVTLYPWQKWLLIHALELNEDGTYRFRKVFFIVGRQNGKTLLITVLALWWLFVDSESFPEHLPPNEFLVLGTAQNLDTAEDTWEEALKRCNPVPEEDDEHLAIPALQALTRRPSLVNGRKALTLKSGAKYIARAATRRSGRSKSAPRIIMDEFREQTDWEAWASVSKTALAQFNSQLWGVTNAGDAKSIVLKAMRDGLLAAIKDWDDYVEKGLRTLEEWANEHDATAALFEWSAHEDADIDDIDAILQSNPTVGHRPMMLENILSDLRGHEPDAKKRTEILCQWVTAIAPSAIDPEEWRDAADPADEEGFGGSMPDVGSRQVLAVDVTAPGRDMSYVSRAGWREDGLVHGEVVAQRPGTAWVVDFVKEVARLNGITEVAVQSRGAPSSELVEPLERAGLTVIKIEGSRMGEATGKLRDLLRDRAFRQRSQPTLDLAAGNAQVRKLGEVEVWDRSNSAVDIAPLVSVAYAVYGLVVIPPEEQYQSAYEMDGLTVV